MNCSAGGGLVTSGDGSVPPANRRADTPNTAQKAAKRPQLLEIRSAPPLPNHLRCPDLGPAGNNGVGALPDRRDRRLECLEATPMWDLSSEIEDLVL